MFRVVQLEDLEDPRAVQAEKILVDAFGNDNVTKSMIGGRIELLRLCLRTCVRAGIVGGKFYVALTEEGEVIGTAIWYPPGSDFLADEKQQQEGGTEFLTRMAIDEPELHDWWMNTFLPLNSETSNKYLGKDFKFNNWNLNSLCVIEEHRRKGVAKMLVNVGEYQAAAQGVSTCFETETVNNRNIYSRLGYETVGYDFIPGPRNEGGFDFYCLVKYFDGSTKAESI